MPTPAPVAVFAYRRPDHLMRTLSALAENDLAASSDLEVFVDGPRSPADVADVMAVRAVAETVSGFASIRVTAADSNQGLSRSLTGGITETLRHQERVIVVEDDIVVSPHFLDYMNDHLDLYANDPAVASIHGYVYPHPETRLDDTFFIRGADCWGWGTWRRAWEAFNPDGAYLLRELRRRELVRVFDFEGAAPYEQMLIDQIAGRNDSWAVRWYASALLNDMLTLYPSEPMAINIGEDGSGTHRGSSVTYRQQLSMEPIPARRIPVSESPAGREAFRRFFRSRYGIPGNALGRWAWRQARRARSVVRR